MNAMDFLIKNREGRKLIAWQDSLPEPTNPPVLICGGFSRRMSTLSALACYLLKNGANVYRFDYLDHVGLSEGEILDFTIASMEKSLESVLPWVSALEGETKINLLAISLGAVPAVFQAVKNPNIAALGCLVGVVHARSTFERVFGTDYYSWEFDRLPDTIVFEGHKLNPRGLWQENLKTGVADFPAMKDALSKLSVPVMNLVASEDQWLTLEEVNEAFSVPGGGGREIVDLPYGGHELARNPLALRLAMKHMIAGFFYDGDISRVSDPSFEEIADFRVADRNRSRGKELHLFDLSRNEKESFAFGKS
ncbi:acyl transferase [Leptospira fletcheri]|uniref:Acyl transferase n=1 Tax=Leptospira fletcheri TaxID=2484981 RepID=A0A4R9G5H1_9LEPT|nr:acyl transferase [Leptospira fletcheri]TGK06405.1 acyl transferase [Leptospira fletcheri]